jgi:hypothetical protein
MNVHIVIPYDIKKNLGKVYNEEMERIPDGNAACLKDWDVQLLTPDAGKILHDYANLYPDNLLTCYTNRVHPLAKMQLLNGEISDNTDIKHHIELAEKQKENLYQVSEVNHWIAGMLMVLSKEFWKKHPFPENGRCLGVDTTYSINLRRRKAKILRMDGLYVFHQYRIMKGIENKQHLK